MKLTPPAAPVTVKPSRFSRVALLLLTTIASGCASSDGGSTGTAPGGGGATGATLNQGYAALEARQYDQAMAAADAFLRATPAGPGSAEAMYLRGRALEQRVTDPAARPGADEARTSLQSARLAYINALKLSPSPQLEAYTRASLANVAYFQDDYATALQQWSAAYNGLDQPDVKAWALYRIGLSQQRLGQFEAADRSFAAVRQQFPASEPARRAEGKQGARGFVVQLATFNNPNNAERAVAALRRQGVLPNRTADAQGRSQVRVGPVQTYAQAMDLKRRFAAEYPEALIIP